ncbi:MAG: glycosyltransferase, partial [Anaerolineae bacterium]|nr:glycosyltransferase [Anaerolineae bacterium]
QATDVYVAPLRMGSGTRLKILEAMTVGCAIVATTLAAAGLPDDAKNALVIADGAADTAEAVVALLQNPERRAQLGQQAQTIVSKHYDWTTLIPRLLAAYKDIGLG